MQIASVRMEHGPFGVDTAEDSSGPRGLAATLAAGSGRPIPAVGERAPKTRRSGNGRDAPRPRIGAAGHDQLDRLPGPARRVFRSRLPHRLSGMTTLPCLSFEAAIDAVREGRAELGMLPCENSLAGRVSDIHHLLPDSGLFIIGEQFQRVEHCLLGVKGATLADVRRAHSHTVALGQVRRILAELRLTPVVEADTAGAAQLVAAMGQQGGRRHRLVPGGRNLRAGDPARATWRTPRTTPRVSTSSRPGRPRPTGDTQT